jgi:hypothetical protein
MAINTFIPARNKLEAVARISQLTNSGPEELGPGSKERRSVLVNLANGIGVSSDSYESKQALAEAIAIRLGLRWTSNCESVGQTITLTGLNLLLEGGEKFFAGRHISGDNKATDLLSEVGMIRKVLDHATPRYMDGRSSVLEMQGADADNWRQTEWQGWYFEFKALPALINQLGGGPKVIENTKFDYALIRPWDLKVHSSTGLGNKPNNGCQLNDQESMKEAAKASGLGLIVLSGTPKYDDESFSEWHKALRGKVGPVRRRLKNGFTSEKIEFFYISDLDDLERAVGNKVLKDFKQGKQPTGEPRAPKYLLDINKARQDKIKIDELNFS